MTFMITLKDVHKRFDGRPVISGCNLAVRPGEVIGLLGPSGAGKSTLLRMVAGLEKPDKGEVRVASAIIGYVFQEARLLPWDTVLQNIVLPLRARGMEKREAVALARYYLRRMEMEEVATSFPHALSGGMRQRVGLARALAIRPDILLLDEPFTGLDKPLKERMRQLLESVLKDVPAAVVHVTHEPEELLAQTDRIIRLGRDATG